MSFSCVSYTYPANSGISPGIVAEGDKRNQDVSARHYTFKYNIEYGFQIQINYIFKAKN